MSAAGDFDFSKLDVIDYLRSGALVVAFIATAFADKKGESSVWLTADALAGGAFGVGLYLFPSILIDYQLNVKSDFMLEFLVRGIGAFLLGMSITFYYCSKDRAVSSAWLLHRVLAGFAVFQLMFHSHNDKAISFKVQHVSFGLLACALWTLGNLIHLFRESSFGSVRREGIRRDSDSSSILVHVLLAGTHSIIMIAMPRAVAGPEYVTNLGLTMTEAHVHLVQILGTLLLTSCIFNLLALNFNNADDRKAYFKGMLWTAVFVAVFSTTLFSKFKSFSNFFWCMQVLRAILCINAMKVIGCLKWVPCGYCTGLVNWCKGQ